MTDTEGLNLDLLKLFNISQEGLLTVEPENEQRRKNLFVQLTDWYIQIGNEIFELQQLGEKTIDSRNYKHELIKKITDRIKYLQGKVDISTPPIPTPNE
jgi:hypothetical protein